MRNMRSPYQRLKREAGGQALVETALMLPFLLGVAFNVVNFGYFFLVALNVAAAPRSGVEFSIMGFNTPAHPEYAKAGPPTLTKSVAYLTYQDMIGAISSPGTQASLQICSEGLGLGADGTAKCVTCASNAGTCSASSDSPGGTHYTDPESSFILNRVDVTYTFTPLLDQRIFNLVLLATPVCTGSGGGVTCTFHRQASMRAM